MKKRWMVAGLVVVAMVAGVVLIGCNAPESGCSEAEDVAHSQDQGEESGLLDRESKSSDMVYEYKKYDPPIRAAEHEVQAFSDIDFDDVESVLNGCTTLSNAEQCKMFFHSNEWGDLDQSERDGNAYWKEMDVAKTRAENTYYLCSFKYDSQESGIVTFVMILDCNDKKEGILFPFLFVRERDGWRMALNDVGYGKDIEMFYSDAAFFGDPSKVNEDAVSEAFGKIRDNLKEDS